VLVLALVVMYAFQPLANRGGEGPAGRDVPIDCSESEGGSNSGSVDVSANVGGTGVSVCVDVYAQVEVQVTVPGTVVE
jgi:hypothetical protein